jgi:prefoldin subunit 5
MTGWTLWLIVGLTLASVICVIVVMQMQRSYARERAIQRFLDSADALERDLQECKKRMQAIQDWVARIPNEGTRKVSSMINADGSVAAALKLVLSRRLWLRDNHESASLIELKQAEENLVNSRASLAENMTKLEQMRVELERATDQLEMVNRSNERPKPVVVSGANQTLH